MLLYIGMVLDSGCAKSFISVEFKNPWAFEKRLKTQNCQQYTDEKCLTVLILKQYHAIFKQEHVCLCNNRLLSFSRNKQLGSKSPLNTVLINFIKHYIYINEYRKSHYFDITEFPVSLMTFHFSVSISTNLLYKVQHSFMLSSKYNVLLKIRFYDLLDSLCKMMSAKYGNYASGAGTECGQYFFVLVLFPQFFVTQLKDL